MIPQNHMLAFLFLLPAEVLGWMEPRALSTTILGRRAPPNVRRQLQVGPLESTSDPNPCWQDLYDDDCAMETLAAASYVAAEWIKKLPCAKGIEDCDYPEETRVPEIRPESHPEVEVSVMEFLNIKRAREVKNND